MSINYYYCCKCNGITQRESTSKSIKSFCGMTGKNTVLKRIDNAQKLSVNLRKKFLKNMIRVESFDKNERLFLNMAFEQGALVVLNGLRPTINKSESL